MDKEQAERERINITYNNRETVGTSCATYYQQAYIVAYPISNSSKTFSKVPI